MTALRVTKLDVKKDPQALLRLFVILSLLSILLVMLLASFGFRQVLQSYVTKEAEDDAINVSRALLADERERIEAVVLGAPFLPGNAAQLPELDRRLRRFLPPFSIVKIKIYSADCRVVYSTDRKIIGEVNGRNSRLRNALSGHYDTKLEKKEQVLDLTDEVNYNVDVVETYIPILANDKKVIGSFEIYMNVTKYRQASRHVMTLFLGILAAILFLGFGLSFPFIRKGTRDLREIQEVLRKRSISDPLTGIYNKKEILLIAQREFARALRRRHKRREDVALGFIMLDVDRFKNINDTYGHFAGDEVLLQLAGRITDSLRKYDTVGRFGGEEFLVVLPGADLDQTKIVAQKIWRLVREEPFLTEKEELTVTASLGFSTLREEDGDFLQVLRRADDALYAAKKQGRDRIEHS